MQSPRRPSIGKLAAGSAVSSVVALVCVAAASSSVGCSSAEIIPAPDAALPPCEEGPFLFSCDPVPAEQLGCDTAAGASLLLTRVAAARYPVGCVIQSVGPRDPQGDCQLDAVCKCVYAESPPPEPPPPPDAGDGGDDGGVDDAGDGGGDDAGDDAGANVERAQPVPVAARPTWQCHP